MSKDLRNTLIAVALFIALAGVMIYFVTDTQAEIEVVQKQNEDLDTEIKGYETEIKQAERLKRQLEELNANFRDYVKILPSAEVATEEKLLKVIQNYIDLAQIRLDEVITKAASKTSGGGKGGEFQEVAVSFRIAADFDSFVRFLNLLERHEQFLKVNSFTVAPAGGPGASRTVEGKEIIDLNVGIEVTTYKYIPKK